MLEMRRPLCNGKPETAPRLGGKPFILCWRCSGGVVGLFLYFILFQNIMCEKMKLLGLLLCIPAILDFYLNKFKVKRPSNVTRFLSGLLLGICVGCFETVILVCLF